MATTNISTKFNLSGDPTPVGPFAAWPEFDTEMIEAVTRVLQSGKVNYWSGNEGSLFESEFADICGCEYAVAVANGTVALELALAALNIGPGDDVVVTSRTFVASASAIIMRGANPIFADVDPLSQNVTAKTIEAVLTPQTKAVIAVHLNGWPCDMDPILNLARERNFKVIEDCAQAHGATDKGRPVGSMGDIAAFSFCQDKIMTTGGEGGLVTTNNRETWGRAWSFKDHGKDWDAVHNRQHKTVFKWLHESIGTNWRMTEMQAAIGRVALKRLPNWVARRRQNAQKLNAAFAEVSSLRITIPPPSSHSYYKYYVFLRLDSMQPGWSRDRIVKAIQAVGVQCGSGICPEIYLEKMFDDVATRPQQRRPIARELGETSLMFLVHPTLSDTNIDDTIAVVRNVLRMATFEQTESLRAA